MRITILSKSERDGEGFISVRLSNHCNIRMTLTCWIDLGWEIGGRVDDYR